MNVLFLRHLLLERLYSDFDTFVKNQCHIFVSGLPVTFHQLMCLSLHQYHTDLIITALKYILSSGSALLSLRIVVALQDPMHFHISLVSAS